LKNALVAARERERERERERLREREERGFVKLGFKGVLSPLI
jgi:hypothetical protein